MNSEKLRGRPLDRPFAFTVAHASPEGSARTGLLQTGHGDIPTPAFMPVGTAGTVKAVTFDQLWDTGYRLILGNTYHLYLRPGHKLIESLGGLHRFQGWDGALLTDSAGFQVFSLAELNRITDEGVAFRSHLDGSRHFFTPELSMEVQLALGADIVMAFDQCPPYSAEADEARAAVRRTTLWLQRCREILPGRLHLAGWERVLFGIMQGGVSETLRRQAAEQILAFDLPGYAIGGLSVGEPTSALREMTELAAGLLPAAKPRYLMGVGFPDDILAAVAAGVDMFDCVLPTRMARTGTVLTWDGRLVVKNREFEADPRPLVADCACPVCRRHSRAYVRHLFQAGEILAPMLATLHNLYFYSDLMVKIRLAIAEDRFEGFARETASRWQAGEARRLAEVARRRD